MSISTIKIIIAAVKSTCWKDKPNNKNSEVIEFGACLLDVKTGNIEHKIGTLVQPKFSRIDHYCTERTGISQYEVEEKGMTFLELCTFIKEEFDTKKYAWAGYGDFVRVLIQRQCFKSHVWTPFSNTYVNAKYLFALKYHFEEQVGLYKALEVANLKFVGEQRNAFDEAMNTAHLLYRTLNSDYHETIVKESSDESRS